MLLSKIHIVNFRNFSEFSTTFASGLNVVVGENNIGKTNLLDAIRVALGGAASTGEAPRVTRDDRHRRPDGSYLDQPIKIDLTFSDLTLDQRAEFLDILNYDAKCPDASVGEIHYEWSWPENSKRWSIRRVGGSRANSEGAVPDEVLQSLPVTMLGALRDALVALSPGRSNRLGHLLGVIASKEQRNALESIIRTANNALESDTLIKSVEATIGAALKGTSGEMRQDAAIRAAEPQFERLVASLRLVLKERGLKPDSIPMFTELRSNGLGYNNLLYIATVLSELDAARDAALPLLLVEEPEAHLHPQLQTVLAEFLAQGSTRADHRSRVQTIVTTHSPTLAAHVAPTRVQVLHRNELKTPRSISLASCGLVDREMRQLQRMLDVTKATLLFARGIVLVEGISEALLLPVLGERLGLRFAESGVSIIPLAGVDFSTIAKLFGSEKLTIPVSIVTDADPGVTQNPDATETPKHGPDGFHICDRVRRLGEIFKDNAFVSIFHSQVTLEYDLAEAGPENATVLFDAWASCYARHPRSLTRESLAAAGSTQDKALQIWRAICRGEPSHGKAELAQALAELLEERQDDRRKIQEFKVPAYIEQALRHALGLARDMSHSD